jgi:hypothetical protein
MVKNFRYEQPGAIALSGVPETPEAVDWLHQQGIRAVLSLHPVPQAAQERMREIGMAWHPFLLSDFAAGVPADMDAALEHVRRHAGEEPAVLIH